MVVHTFLSIGYKHFKRQFFFSSLTTLLTLTSIEKLYKEILYHLCHLRSCPEPGVMSANKMFFDILNKSHVST